MKEENVVEKISDNIKNELAESKFQSQNRFPEIAVTVIGLAVAVVLMCFGLASFWLILMIAFGAVWNFFSRGNKLLACVVSFPVCLILGLFSSSINLYGVAFLHICFYLPTQLIYYYENQKIENVGIRKDKFLSKTGMIGCVVSTFAFALTLMFVLYSIGEKYFIVDAISVALLSLSVFLVNGGYREYWIVRLVACAFSSIMWVGISVGIGLSCGGLAVALLFAMYVVMDSIKFLSWRKCNRGQKKELVAVGE